MRLLSPLFRYFPLLLAVGIVSMGIWYVCSHPDQLAAIGELSLGWLALLFSLSAAKLVSMGAFTKVIVGSMGIRLDFVEWFGGADG